MSKGDAHETAYLKLVYQAVAWANVADNTGTSPCTNISVALHTADPGEAGTQLTSEATYTGYTRINVARTTGGWAVAAGVANPVAAINFPQCSAGTNTITHFSTGTGTANFLLHSGTVSPSINVAAGVSPQLTTASSISED